MPDGNGIELLGKLQTIRPTFVVRLPTIDTPAKAEPPAPALHPHVALSPLSILLVEDHVDTATVMGRLLTDLGHQVQIAGTVAAALGLAKEHKFDLLLSDIGLSHSRGALLPYRLTTHRRLTNGH